MRLFLSLCVASLLMGGASVVHANEAMMRGLQDIQSKFQRQFDQLESKQEQERIKLNARMRDERAKLQRETQAAMAKVLTLNGDSGTMARLQFEQAELTNRFENEWSRELDDRFDKERAALERKKSLENAKVGAEYFEAGEDTARARGLMLKGAEVTDRWQARLDDLRFEENAAINASCRAGKTKENAAARDMAVWLAKKVHEQQTAGQLFNALGDPTYLELTAKRDDARNATETEQEMIRAKFEDRRRDLERSRDEELGKIEF